MASFIYLYSKFTEEFLLLSAAGIFALLAVYCYHWVVKTRRLGAARNQVPAGMVKVYLNQLIGEAQFVRTQLFGLINGEASPQDAALRFQMPNVTAGSSSGASLASAAPMNTAGLPADLLERLKALENQLSEKEGMVINVNIEKTKLLEEIENLKQNQSAAQGAAGANADNTALLAKMKALEERLEEYALFEDDLANLKRLQQENASLKKRLSESGPTVVSGGNSEASNSEKTVVSAGSDEDRPEPEVTRIAASAPAPKVAEDPFALDQSAIDALLDGASPGTPSEAQEASTADDFEKLLDSVESSLEKTPAPEPAPVAVAAAPAPAPAPVVAAPAPAPSMESAAPAASDSAASKTDEELLKEFESLLNS